MSEKKNMVASVKGRLLHIGLRPSTPNVALCPGDSARRFFCWKYPPKKGESLKRLKILGGLDRSKGKAGYEINLTKYFYEHRPLRSVEEITRELMELDWETEG